MKLITFEKSVGAVVFRKEGDITKYLLLKYIGGHWSFPKGHEESGEKEKETLLREIKEETGNEKINIIPSFKTSSFYCYSAKDDERKERIECGKCTRVLKKVIFYLAETKEADITLSHEHLDYKWLGYDDALTTITYGNDRRVFRKAHSFLKKII